MHYGRAVERWLSVGALITFASGLIACAAIPFTGMSSVPSPVAILLWMCLMVIVGGLFVVVDLARLAKDRNSEPLRFLTRRYMQPSIILGCLLLGINLFFFGIIKPQLGQMVAFWADPLLADIEHAMLGTDAWRLTTWFDHPGMEYFYHQLWFFWLAVVLFAVLLRPPSAEKDALLIGYLALWSIFGPVVHLLLPAAGPVFYEALGHGDRFTGLYQTVESRQVAAYLWDGYVNRTFNPAGGISAMPSLHLATMFWSIIALRKSRWAVLASVLTAYIWIGSVAIGWHYMIDGLAGGAGASLCYGLAVARKPGFPHSPLRSKQVTPEPFAP